MTRRLLIKVIISVAVAIIIIVDLKSSRSTDNKKSSNGTKSVRNLSLKDFADPKSASTKMATPQDVFPPSTRVLETPRSVFFPNEKNEDIRGGVIWIKDVQKRNNRAKGCLRYKCSQYTEPHCKDEYMFAETDYNGVNPPCCAHILRDMLRVTDEALGELGLEYFSGYGALLGLVRNDHLIPWTADNDFVVSFAVAKEIWNERNFFNDKYGLNIFSDFFLRSCASESFMGGALLKWRTHEYDTAIYEDHLPYSDFFYGEVDPTSGKFIDERGCGYDVSSFRPMKRLSVYSNSFFVSVPNDYIMVIENAYGPNWKTPQQNLHGNTFCRMGRRAGFFRDLNPNGIDQKWIKHWNDLLKNATDDATRRRGGGRVRGGGGRRGRTHTD